MRTIRLLWFHCKQECQCHVFSSYLLYSKKDLRHLYIYANSVTHAACLVINHWFFSPLHFAERADNPLETWFFVCLCHLLLSFNTYKRMKISIPDYTHIYKMSQSRLHSIPASVQHCDTGHTILYSRGLLKLIVKPLPIDSIHRCIFNANILRIGPDKHKKSPTLCFSIFRSLKSSTT